MEETIRYHIEIHSKANRIRPMFGNSISIVGVGRFNPCKSVFLYGDVSLVAKPRVVIPLSRVRFSYDTPDSQISSFCWGFAKLVRQRILIPPFRGSSPLSPAIGALADRLRQWIANPSLSNG